MSEQLPRQRRKVLSEEAYTSTLSMIIQRDYYPSLAELERKSAVLERRLHGDVPGAVAVRRAARKLADHDEALTQQEEGEENKLVDGTRKRPRPLHRENLTGFHARATNEDDREFDSQQKREVQANRERLEELFRPPNNGVKMIEMSNMASDQFQPESNRPPDYPLPAARNGLFFSPTPLLNGGDAESLSVSTKLLASGEHPNANSQLVAMPPPPAKIRSESTLGAKSTLVEYIPKGSLEKKMEPSQTRFPTKIIPFQASRFVLGTNLRQSDTDCWSTDASTDLDAPLRSIDYERRRRERKSAKDNRSYVNMTPLLVPGAGSLSPITTWGTVDSTPLILSGSDNPDGVTYSTTNDKLFPVAGETERELAARKAEKALDLRAKRAKSTPRSRAVKRKGPFAPAATCASRQSDAFASALRGSYTPKVRSMMEGSIRRRSTRDHVHNATPLASRSQKKK